MANSKSVVKPIQIFQIQRIHALLPEAIKNDREAKEDIIVQFTGDESKTSTKDLNFYQAHELISSLEGKSVSYAMYAYFDSSNKQHRYLLSLCRQMGWVTFNLESQKTVADLSRLGAWLIKTGYLHKPLKEYSEAELPKLVKQFERVATNSINQ